MNNEQIVSRFNDAAVKYDEQRKLFIPCYDDYYGVIQSFLKYKKIKAKSVLDLGAGTGLLTKFVMEILPHSSYTLIDLSEKMLEIAKSRFSDCNNLNYEIKDYVLNFPHGKFDLIVSALSIHHMEENAKQNLYSRIYDSLNDNGYLINLDQFNADSEDVNNFYTEYWYDFIQKSGINEIDMKSWLQRRELDKENSISKSIQMIKNVGFNNVECIYQYMKFGVLVAYK
jgi:ubiquinone/menaquinone biosynthesis C-methylase UbiE